MAASGTPAPLQFSRYRSIRGRNVPSSRQYKEPDRSGTIQPEKFSPAKPAREPQSPAQTTPEFSFPHLVPLSAQDHLAEQKRQDLQRLRQQLENHQPAASSSRPPSEKKFSLFARLRGHQSPPVPPVPPVPSVPASVAAVEPTTVNVNNLHSPKDETSSHPDQAAGKTVPVRCSQFSARIPFEPDTSVASLLQSSPSHFPCDIHPDVSVLVESCMRLGLERPLRRFERVRDVCNSWDNSSDNALVLSSDSKGIAPSTLADLELSSVSRKAVSLSSSSSPSSASSSPSSSSSPGFTFVRAQCLQKRGWSSCYVSLLEETGQLVVSKKADAARLASLSANDGAVSSSVSDFQAIGRLSDYDIYRPTEAQLRKHLKPPKKACYAIKSQQRKAVFVDADSYIHYFCIEDPAQANLFYERIFAWRSAYLARTLAKMSSPRLHTTRSRHPAAGTATATVAATATPSATSAMPGSLISRIRSNEPSDFASGSLLGSAYDERKAAEALKKNEVAGTQTSDAVRTESTPFTGGSLLDSYVVSPPTTRPEQLPTSWFPSAAEHSAQARKQASNQASNQPSPSSSRPSTSSGGSHANPTPKTNYPPSRQRSDQDFSMSRHRSVRRAPSQSSSGKDTPRQQHPAMPAPLIDLTPKFQEAPQWSTENRGRGVRAPRGTTHLVDLATGHSGRLADAPDSILEAPFRRDDRRTQTMTAGSAAAASSMQRSHHTIHHSPRMGDHFQTSLLSRIPPNSSTSRTYRDHVS